MRPHRTRASRPGMCRLSDPDPIFHRLHPGLPGLARRSVDQNIASNPSSDGFAMPLRAARSLVGTSPGSIAQERGGHWFEQRVRHGAESEWTTGGLVLIFLGYPRCSCHSQRHSGRSVAVFPGQQRQTTCNCSIGDYHELWSSASRSTPVLGQPGSTINISTGPWRRRQSCMMDHSQTRLVACWTRHVRPGGFSDHLAAPVPLLIHEQGCFEQQPDVCRPCSRKQAGGGGFQDAASVLSWEAIRGE